MHFYNKLIYCSNMSVFVTVSECEMHFCKYYIDGNIGEGNFTLCIFITFVQNNLSMWLYLVMLVTFLTIICQGVGLSKYYVEKEGRV